MQFPAFTIFQYLSLYEFNQTPYLLALKTGTNWEKGDRLFAELYFKKIPRVPDTNADTGTDADTDTDTAMPDESNLELLILNNCETE